LSQAEGGNLGGKTVVAVLTGSNVTPLELLDIFAKVE